MRKQDELILKNHEKVVKEFMSLKGYTPISLNDISLLNETYLRSGSEYVFEELMVKLQLVIVKILEFIPLNFERQSINDMSDCINYFNIYFITCIEDGKFINIEGISEVLTRNVIDGLRMLTYSEDDERALDHIYDAMYNPYEGLIEELDEELEEVRLVKNI